MAVPLNILIVEDSEDDAALVLATLRQAGFDPQWKRVQTEPDFLAEIKKSPDIILSDFSMPEFNGLRAVELLQASGLNIPLILVSGTVGEEVAVEAMKHGAVDYLLKDRIARLGGAVERALREAQAHKERKHMAFQLEQMQNQLLAVSRQAGMEEFATGVLHNVGNVLNSVNVTTTCLADSLKKSKSASLVKVVELMRQHEADLGAFFTHDPKGKQLPAYLAQLADHLAREHATALNELGELQKSVEHIKKIITVQQDSSKMSRLTESLKLTDLVEDALKLNANGLTRANIQVIREFEEIPPTLTEQHKVLQILVNLVRNALQACETTTDREKRLTVRVNQAGDRGRITVADNGSGIRPEHLSRIFTHGFTTKPEGHGFGLHNAALVAQEMGGALTVQSEGPGRGATFTLELPMKS